MIIPGKDILTAAKSRISILKYQVKESIRINDLREWREMKNNSIGHFEWVSRFDKTRETPDDIGQDLDILLRNIGENLLTEEEIIKAQEDIEIMELLIYYTRADREYNLNIEEIKAIDLLGHLKEKGEIE